MSETTLPRTIAHAGHWLRAFCLLAVFLCLSPSIEAASAHTIGSVRGFVTDAETGEALHGANVVIRQGDNVLLGTAANGDGFFVIQGIPDGEFRIEASFLGYITYRDTMHVAPNDVRNLRIALTPSPTDLGELIVEAESEHEAAISAGLSRIRAAELERIPLPDVAGDLASYLQVLPGVISSGDRGGQLFIRGGTPSQNLILIDGIPIYQPFHMIGFFSAFPSEIVHHADIYAGGFDAVYGGRLSSVIDIAARNGNKRRLQASASIAPFLTTLTVEGPLSKDKTSILLSARESLFERAFPGVVSNLPFVFGDQFVKIHSVLSESQQVSLTALRSHDRGVVDDTERLPSAVPGGRDGSADDEIRWTNGVIGLRYLILPEGKPLLGDLSISYSRVSNSFGPDGNPDRSSEVGNFRVGALVTRGVGVNSLRWGVTIQNLHINYTLDGTFQDLDENDETRVDAGFFMDYTHRLGTRIDATAGLHTHLYAGTGSTVEPRARVVWRLTDGGLPHHISAAWGVYSQNLVGLRDERDAGDIFTAWLTSPLSNDIPRAMHSIVGWHLQPTGNLSIDVEGYHRVMTDLVIPQWSPIAKFTTALQSARGRVYGMDARVEYARAPFYVYASYGLSNVLYTATQGSFGLWYGVEHASFHPPHDRRHQLSLLSTYTRGRSSFSVQWQFGSGLPFTRPIGFDDWIYFENLVDVTAEAGEYRVLFERPYQGRLPMYHRLDISAEHQVLLSRTSLTLKAGLMNAYDRNNLFYYDVWSLRRVSQMAILPWVGVKLDLL